MTETASTNMMLVCMMHDCVSRHRDRFILKLADDTVIVSFFDWG